MSTHVGSGGAPSAFVNEGLIRWEAQREQWLKGKDGKTQKAKSTEVRYIFRRPVC